MSEVHTVIECRMLPEEEYPGPCSLFRVKIGQEQKEFAVARYGGRWTLGEFAGGFCPFNQPRREEHASAIVLARESLAFMMHQMDVAR